MPGGVECCIGSGSKQLTLAAVGFERYAKNDAAGSISAEMEQVVPWPALCALRRDSALGIRRGITIPRSGVKSLSRYQQDQSVRRRNGPGHLARLSFGHFLQRSSALQAVNRALRARALSLFVRPQGRLNRTQ